MLMAELIVDRCKTNLHFHCVMSGIVVQKVDDSDTNFNFEEAETAKSRLFSLFLVRIKMSRKFYNAAIRD